MLFGTVSPAHRTRTSALALGTVACARLPDSSTTVTPDAGTTLSHLVTVGKRRWIYFHIIQNTAVNVILNSHRQSWFGQQSEVRNCKASHRMAEKITSWEETQFSESLTPLLRGNPQSILELFHAKHSF